MQWSHSAPNCIKDFLDLPDHTLNDFKNAPLFKIVYRRMNKVINYTYVTDQFVTICRLILVFFVRSVSLDVNVLVIDVFYVVLISVE